LIKTAAKVTVSSRRVLVELGGHAPFSVAIRQILHRLRDNKVVSLY
jgi:hypothetical protein